MKDNYLLKKTKEQLTEIIYFLSNELQKMKIEKALLKMKKTEESNVSRN